MMKLGILTFILLLSNITFTQSRKSAELQNALNAGFNFEFQKSDSLLNKIITEHPHDPIGYVYTAQNYLWKYLGSKDEGELGVFWKYSELAEEKNTSADNSGFSKFISGWNQFLQSIAYSSQDEMFDAFSAAKSAYGTFDELIEENPDFYEPYLGRGLIKYSLSYTPGIFRWILTLIGLNADKQSGFTDVKTAFVNFNSIQPEAGFHYARLLVEYSADYEQAKSILINMRKQFPQNLLFNYQLAVTAIKMKDFNQAEIILGEITTEVGNDFPRTIDLSYFLLGECSYFQQDFETAEKYYRSFIKRAKSIDYTGLANLRLAFCASFLNKTNESEKHLLFTSMGNEELDEDKFAANLTKAFFVHGIDQVSQQIEKSRLSIELEDFNTADSILGEINKQYLNPEQLLKIKFFEGKLLYGKQKFEKAISILSNENPDDFIVENQLRSQFFLLLAECEFGRGNSAKALHLMELAEEANNGLFASENSGLINRFRKKMSKNVQKM